MSLLARANMIGRVAAAVAALWAVPAVAAADQDRLDQIDFPVRNVTVIVPFAKGGPSDTVARIVTAEMAKTLGHPVQIENVVGAGGTLGATRVAQAAPDGYTLIVGHMGTHGAAMAVYPRLGYSPDKDFEPIALLTGMPVLLVARKEFPPKDMKEFAAFVRAHTDNVNVAHAGIGSVSYSSCLLLDRLLDLNPTGVPFNGTGPAMKALVEGQVDYMCDQIVNALPELRAGTIKAYAIASPARDPALPQIPTAGEAGVPGFQVEAWNALFAPRGTPGPIVAKLNAAVSRALDAVEVRDRLADLGGVVPGPDQRTPGALAQLVRDEVAKWTRVLRGAAP